jgi:ribosomal-protein-alanine N-acetyltransferase
MKAILETKRLRLREFSLADVQIIFDLNEDPEVIRYVGDPRCENLEAARSVLTDIILPQYEQYNMGRWAVELIETGEVVGWCGIKYLPESKEYDLGYRFFRKYWGKGYATESAMAVLEYGHRKLGLEKIVGKADARNTGSVNVLQKIGMKFERSGEEHCGNARVYLSVR